jgi:uncharacterized protein YcbK (DUF882 family)
MPVPPAFHGTGISRRRLLACLAGAAAAAIARPVPLSAAAPDRRVLSFVHTHTGGRLTIAYREGEAFLQDGLAALNRFLKDFRTGHEYPMDAALFDVLSDLTIATGTTEPFQVISAYRSPASNAMLRERGRGVASGSLHTQGRAIDIRLADVPTDRLRDAALALQRGGVGYYGSSDFIHVDTGRVRRW